VETNIRINDCLRNWVWGVLYNVESIFADRIDKEYNVSSTTRAETVLYTDICEAVGLTFAERRIHEAGLVECEKACVSQGNNLGPRSYPTFFCKW